MISFAGTDAHEGRVHTGLGRWNAWPVRLLLALAVTLLAVVALGHSSTAQAHALSYACNGHCYAYAETVLPAGSQGVTTKIYVGHMLGGSVFIDNEMWLDDLSGQYWVEAGYEALNGSGGEHYFWADLRPGDVQLNEHELGVVPSGDYGQNPTFAIRRSGSTSFHVTISSPNYSFSGYSTNNTMGVGFVDMGQELVGTDGAYAPNARYSYRYYWNSAGSQVGIYSQYSLWYDNPPYINVVSGNTDFYTHCC